MTNIINENDDRFYKITIFDLILIGLIIFFSAFSILWVSANQISQSSQSKVAIIYQENTKLMEIDVKKDELLPILDGKMQIEVNNGRIRVKNSDCPQHVCAKMGWIQSSGQTIVCMPNHVLIEIKSAGSQSFDTISY